MKTFKVIDCKDYIYISEINSSWNTPTMYYLFDGEKAVKTNKKDWYKLDKIPTTVSQRKPNIKINTRYELKAGYTPTDLLPQIITMEMYNTNEYEKFSLSSGSYKISNDGSYTLNNKIQIKIVASNDGNNAAPKLMIKGVEK